MAIRTSTLIGRLERRRHTFGGNASSEKLKLLEQLERRRASTADQVSRLHESLVFMQAYPDDLRVQRQVRRMLSGFGERSDLRRHAEELQDSGIVGTEIYFPFFYFTAIWLTRRWPAYLRIDWAEFENASKLEDLLQFLVPYSETPGLDMVDYSPRQWVERLKGPEETDASFLLRRFQALRADDFAQELIYESLDVPLRIVPGPTTPSRTGAKLGGVPPAYQTGPLVRSRPDLRVELQASPVAVRALSPSRAEALVDLMREAMVTRERDLYSFSHVDPRDVRLVDCGNGLQFACFGTIPLRRLVLEALYGCITLKNGVPIGYVLASSLFGSTEVAYNVFESFRDAEAGAVFGRALSMTHRLFGSDAFAIDPYQMGYGNPEGLASGAWWFYYKFGFRPTHRGVRELAQKELRRIEKNPAHRSSLATLQQLASEPMYWYAGGRRSEIMLRLPLGNVGLAISRYLADRFGAEREAALQACSREAQQLLRTRTARFTDEERLAWERWSPLVLILPGVRRWSLADKRALARVIQAKGGRRESDYVRLFDAHLPLRRAVVRLARRAESSGPSVICSRYFCRAVHPAGVIR